jgi:hypothetical protein
VGNLPTGSSDSENFHSRRFVNRVWAPRRALRAILPPLVVRIEGGDEQQHGLDHAEGIRPPLNVTLDIVEVRQRFAVLHLPFDRGAEGERRQPRGVKWVTASNLRGIPLNPPMPRWALTLANCLAVGIVSVSSPMPRRCPGAKNVRLTEIRNSVMPDVGKTTTTTTC